MARKAASKGSRGGSRRPLSDWNKFVKAHKGQGKTLAQLSVMAQKKGIIKKKGVKAKRAEKVSKKCTQKECKAQGKICNKKTGNCIKDTAANRKRLGMVEKKGVKAKRAEKVSKKCTQKECKAQGKICNKKTGNCIKDTAANRKRLGLAAKKAVKKESKRAKTKQVARKGAKALPAKKKALTFDDWITFAEVKGYVLTKQDVDKMKDGEKVIISFLQQGPKHKYTLQKGDDYLDKNMLTYKKFGKTLVHDEDMYPFLKWKHLKDMPPVKDE